MDSKSIRIVPLGGLGEIGMNCLLLETKDSAVLIDCGLMFSDLDTFGVEFVIPNFSKLIPIKDKLKAILVTHGHEDHIGAIPFLYKAGFRLPIYASQFTSLLIRERMKEVALDSVMDVKVIHSGVSFQVAGMKVLPLTVNHSIVDAMAFSIDTPWGRVFHTGDFKVNPTAKLGDVMEWEMMKKIGADGVDLLLSDSTNVERENNEHTHFEPSVASRLDELISMARGLTVITMFSSNVGRVANIFSSVKRLKKYVAFAGRSMDQNIRLAYERGLIDLDAKYIIPIHDVKNYPRNQVVVLSTGCQGEPRSALNRMAHGEYPHVSLTEDDLVIFSSSQIPGNEQSISQLVNNLFRFGSEVLYDSIETVHATGHATRDELAQIFDILKPRHFIPVHGEYRHLVHHAELAMEKGVPEDGIFVAENGDVLELSDPNQVGGAIRRIGEWDELRILVQDREGLEVTKDMLRDRRKLAESGLVVAMLSRDPDDRRFRGEPQVLLRGIAPEGMVSFLTEEATKVVQSQVDAYHRELKLGAENPMFEEELRIELRRFFERNTGKKPVVVPVILGK